MNLGSGGVAMVAAAEDPRLTGLDNGMLQNRSEDSPSMSSDMKVAQCKGESTEATGECRWV